MKGKQAHHSVGTLELVRILELYQKNTNLSIVLYGDGEEIFEYDLPYPHSYERQDKNIYRISYTINGKFLTSNSLRYLNDIIARFTLSMKVRGTYISYTNDDGIDLSSFKGLKSIARAKNYEKVDNGQDNIFWSIKLYTEDLIKESGGMVAYSLLESFALDRFITRGKDKSTLRAKCRSIWNWYDEREWTIPTRARKFTDEELSMSRADNARKVSEQKAIATKNKIQKAIAGLEFMQEKINIANVARDAKVSRNTAKKYLIELGYKK